MNDAATERRTKETLCVFFPYSAFIAKNLQLFRILISVGGGGGRRRGNFLIRPVELLQLEILSAALRSPRERSSPDGKLAEKSRSRCSFFQRSCARACAAGNLISAQNKGTLKLSVISCGEGTALSSSLIARYKKVRSSLSARTTHLHVLI